MKIQPIESQLRPSGTLGGQASADSFGLDTRLAQQNMAELGDYMQRRQEQDAAVRTAAAVAKTRTDMDQQLISMQDSAEAGAPEFTKTFSQTYKDYTDKMLEAENDPVARKLMQIKFAEVGASYTEQAARFESKAHTDKKVMDLDHIGDQYSNLVAANPSQYFDLRTELDGAIKSSGINGNEQEKLKLKSFADMSVSMYKAQILTNPGGVIRELKEGGGAVEDLPAGASSTLMHMADQQLKHLAVKGQQAVVQDAKRNIDLMNQGYEVDPAQRQKIIDVFGDTEDSPVRNELLTAFDNAEAFGKTLHDTAMASPEEVNASFTGLQSIASDTNASPQNREEATKDMARFSAAVRQRNEQLKQDPADYVLSHSEATNQAFATYMDAQKAYGGNQSAEAGTAAAAAQANYVNSMKADQLRLGLPESNMSLLTSDMVSQVKDRVNGIQRTPEGAKNLVNMLAGLHDDWGKDWPIVYRQLREKKAIDGTLDAMAYMTDPTKRSDAALLATAWANRDALDKQIPDDVKKDIREKVESEALPLGTAMSNEGRNEQFVNFKGAATLLAQQLVADGADASTAARTAFDKVVGSDYHVVGKMRIPTTDSNGTALDPDTMLQGAMLAKTAVTKDVATVKSLSGETQGSIDAEMPYHVEDAYWVTANGNVGLQLKWGDKAIVETKDGKPVIYTWDQLKNLYIDNKARMAREQQQRDIEEMLGGAPKPAAPSGDIMSGD